MLFTRLICHFLGNICMWGYYGGKKPIDEVAKKDNSTIGYIILILVVLVLYSYR